MALRQYTWLARSKPILPLLIAWGLSYAGDLAAFTAASVYAFRAGGAGLVAALGLLKALPGAFLVPLVTSGSDRVRRERLLVATVVPRALLLGVAAAAMTGSGQGLLVVVLVGVEGGVASAFRQIQAALLPWLARTPDELTSANSAASVLQSAAMVGGPAIAAGLLATRAAQVAMLVSCGLVAVAAVLLAGVRPLSSEAPVRAAGRLKQLKLDMMAGFDAGVRRRDAMALFVPAAAQTFGRGVLNVLTVVIALELFGLGSADVGWLGAVLGAGGLLLVVLAAAFLPRLTAIDARISAPGPDLALLRQVPFFRPLPFAIVEHLASELQSATYEPGDVIIREGEPGELFYIIAAGQARAAKDGTQLRAMGTGDSFGEIALLRRIPRTATVTVMSRLEVRTLAREEFLAAVTGNPESVERAEEVVSTRLQAGLPGVLDLNQ